MATIDTVAALLAKAERTDNAAEADAYLSKAQQLATLHAIDLELAAARIGRRTNTPTQRTVTVGEPRKHANKSLVWLFIAVAHANDVEVDVAHNSTYVIAYGMPDDIDLVEALWLNVAPRMIAEANRWVRAGQWRTDDGHYVDAHGRRRTRALTAQGARRAFCEEFISAIRARLAAARADAVAEVDLRGADDGRGDSAGTAGGAELVLVEKAETVKAFHKLSSQARGRWRGQGTGTRASRRSASRRAGAAAGRTAPLRSSKAVGGTSGELPQ